MSDEEEAKTTQVTLKVASAFLKDFDSYAEQLGYSRNEAIREAMRRFTEWAYQAVNQRHPEKAMTLVSTMVSGIFSSIVEGAQKLEAQTTNALPMKVEPKPVKGRSHLTEDS